MMTTSILLLLVGMLHLAHGLTEFVVYPTNRKDVSACSRINYALVSLLGDSKVQVYKSQIRSTTEFWFVQILEYQKATILQIPGVDAVMENVIVAKNSGESLTNNSVLSTTNSTEPDEASPGLMLPRRRQIDAPLDLDIVSWPPRKRLPVSGKWPGYWYDVARGVDTYIYIIDNGINKDNGEFKSMPWPPESDEWHYAYGVSKSTTDDDLSGHGSCVASKAAGWTTGVSKNSHLVVMKSLTTLADINFAFAAALDDIILKRRQGRAVVLYPANSIQTFGAKSPLPRNWQSVQELMQDLFAQNVVVVTGSGNDAARSSAVDTVPAVWASDPDFPLLVAGAAKLDGTIAGFSQGWATSSKVVWAPGDSIVCANGPSSAGLAVRSGTSFAAAMVAGLAAYELTGADPPPRAQTIANSIRSQIIRESRPIYPRREPQIVWNGMNVASLANSNSTSPPQPVLQLVQDLPTNATRASGTNVTQGQSSEA
ncbi:peptidase S8/S53 domain-containing protein [Usnea florida]